MPKLSIIIPVYNSEKYLKKTLDSLINQSYKDFDVLCINDCSSDNSLQILEGFAKQDKRVTIINNEKNIGAALSRNVGIDNAGGKYIYFLDSDDYIEEKYLECMVEKIEQENCDIALNLSIITETNGVSSPYKHPSMPEINPNGEYLDKILTIHNAPCFIWARLYKKDFLNNFNLRFLNTHADDVVFNTITTMYSEKTFVFYGENYHYTINPQSMTGQAEISNSKDINHIKAHSIIYDFLKERKILNNNLKLFRVYPFMKVDNEEKFNYCKKFFEKIESDFHKNEYIYNEMEKFFAYSLLNTQTYDEYLKTYNKVVTIGFLRQKKNSLPLIKKECRL